MYNINLYTNLKFSNVKQIKNGIQVLKLNNIILGVYHSYKINNRPISLNIFIQLV